MVMKEHHLRGTECRDLFGEMIAGASELHDALRTMSADARDARCSLANCTGMLRNAVSQQDSRVNAVKTCVLACEILYERATRARKNGADELADNIKFLTFNFSKKVAPLKLMGEGNAPAKSRRDSEESQVN